MAKQVIYFLLAIGFCTVVHALKIDEDIPLRKHISSAERIANYGYPSESHKIETSDGYILNIFRIPYSPKLQNRNEHRPVILLQHGLFSCSDCYLLNGPDNALAYVLADAGYDVWLGNARGNIYSRNNSRISIKHPKFWRFSWHEIGMFDMTAMIDYILAETGESAIHYAGHSQGTTVFFVLMSSRPEYNAKIKTAHMLAPVAFTGNQTSPTIKLASSVLGTPGLWSNLFGELEFVPNNKILQRLFDTACGGNIQFPKFCRNILYLYAGTDQPNVNKTLLPLVAETHPAGVSSNQVLHYLQVHRSSKFCQFDYGPKQNRKLYGQDEPLDYDLEKITAPVYMYYGDSDDSAHPLDVLRLATILPNLIRNHNVPNPTWGHLDFVFAQKVKEEINNMIVDTCNEYESKVRR